MATPIISTGFAKSSAISDFKNPITSQAPSGEVSFADTMAKMAREMVDATNGSETKAISSMAKQTELVDVVTAVTNAEVTLETAVAIRDRVIQAYQSIIRMPI
jgi:flagellar hook-basal body complex protein FliE